MSRTTAGRGLGIFTKREVTDHGFPTGAMCRPLTKNEAIGTPHLRYTKQGLKTQESLCFEDAFFV